MPFFKRFKSAINSRLHLSMGEPSARPLNALDQFIALCFRTTRWSSSTSTQKLQAALFKAISHRDVPRCRALLLRGAVLDAKTADGSLHLNKIFQEGQTDELLTFFHQSGLDLNGTLKGRLDDRLPCLLMALEYGQWANAHYLLEHQQDVFRQGTYRQHLIGAAFEGISECYYYFRHSPTGSTHFKTRFEFELADREALDHFEQLLAKLVDRGGDVNALNLLGRNVLHQHATSPFLVDLMLSYGVNPHLEDAEGHLPLFYAALGIVANNLPADIFNQLLDVTPHAVSRLKETEPLLLHHLFRHLSSFQKNARVDHITPFVVTLLRMGFSMEETDEQGRTAWDCLDAHENQALVEHLRPALKAEVERLVFEKLTSINPPVQPFTSSTECQILPSEAVRSPRPKVRL